MIREEVRIKTTTETLKGELSMSADGLPEIKVTEDAVEGEVRRSFRPAQFPAAWFIWPARGFCAGPLLEAWWQIEIIRDNLAKALREAEQPEPDDEITAYKREAEAKGER